MTDKSSTKSSTKLSTDKIREVLEEMVDKRDIRGILDRLEERLLTCESNSIGHPDMHDFYFNLRQQLKAQAIQEIEGLVPTINEDPNASITDLFRAGFNLCREEMLRRVRK